MKSAFVCLMAFMLVHRGCPPVENHPNPGDDDDDATVTDDDDDDDSASDDDDTTSGPVDNDNDGFTDDVDCDDTDDDIYPGAPDEPGDGIDQDCDGEDAPFVPKLHVSVNGNEWSSHVSGEDNVQVTEFILEALVEDLAVTDLHFMMIGDSDAMIDNGIDNAVQPQDRFASCSLKAGQMLVDGPEAVAANGSMEFENFVFDLTVGTPRGIKVVCDIANLDLGLQIYGATLDPSAITVEDMDGDAVHPEEITTDSSPVNTGLQQCIRVFDHGSFQVLSGAMTNWALRPTMETTVLAIEIDPDIEPVEIEDGLTFQVNTFGNDMYAQYVSLYYRDAQSNVITMTGWITGGEIHFGNVSDFHCEPGGNNCGLELSVVTAENAPPDFQVQASYDPQHPDNEFVGATSGNTMYATTQDVITGNPHQMARPITVTLASGSPAGAAIPGMYELFRFNVSADSWGDITLVQIPFRMISTDNGSSNWNSCGNMADPTKWIVRDWSNGQAIQANWEFRNYLLDPCSNPDSPFGYALVTFVADEVIPAGDTETYQIWVDTTAASAIDDDAVRLDIDWEPGLLWENAYGYQFDGTGVNNLPVTGGTLLY